MQFFIEGTRSRTGKCLHPKLGMLSMITDTFYDKEIPEAHFIPVTLNYERVMEGETFPQQLLGEEKVKESVGRLLRASTVFT